MELLGMFWQEHWIMAISILSFIAFLAGFVDSVAGGGGLFLVPGFLLVGLPPQVALGQEKVVSTLGTIAAIRNFLRESKILWKVAIVGIPFSLLGAYLGAEAILLISPEIVGKVIVFLIPIGILLFLTPKDKEVKEHVLTNITLYTTVPILCTAIGFYDGFFGPGTGSMFIIAFHYLLKLNLVAASANSKMFNFASNIGALVAFIIAKKVLYLLALPLIISNIAGNHVGSHMALKKGSDMVRKVLIFSMFILFLSCTIKYFLK
ncbi:MAG: hypothetical protein RLZZ210_922 [Pseudomonadota bacterium]|jgi:uncharacterized membrane protein YfcA